ncbi:MAG TPA: alkaline phosphatase family protein [Gemmatimonadaceae bacterium]|jgi:predicted AlkP superfamily pyrophosphatase or phosphodiesterase
MHDATGIRRAIVVVLDGLRPDAIELFDLMHLKRLISHGASSLDATTVSPSVTTSAMTSLLTGVSPSSHGIVTDRVFIPRNGSHLEPLPGVLSAHGYPSTAFMGDVSPIFRGIATRVGRRFGFDTLRTNGDCALDILGTARTAIRVQRRGLIVLHWPDADRAGHASGWMSARYADACIQLDAALGVLVSLADALHDPHTLLIALADHGGGGTAANDHDAAHPVNSTIPLLLAGGMIAHTRLGAARLLDVAPTVLAALGVDVPHSYEGRVLTEALAPALAASAAVA